MSADYVQAGLLVHGRSGRPFWQFCGVPRAMLERWMLCHRDGYLILDGEYVLPE